MDGYSRSVPPGWAEGLPHYPFRLFEQKLKLWIQLNELNNAQLGPAIAGRLTGRLFNVAMGLQIRLEDGTMLTEDAALTHEGTAPNPHTGWPGTRSGPQELLHQLRTRFASMQQDLHTGAIDAFENLKRGNMRLLEHLNEFTYLHGQAVSLANYHIGDVAKTHRLLRYCGVPHDQLETLKIMGNHDLAQYDFYYNRLVAMAKSTPSLGGISQLPGRHGYLAECDDDDDSSWYDSWSSPSVWYAGDDWDDDGWRVIDWDQDVEEAWLADDAWYEGEWYGDPDHDEAQGDGE